MLDPCLLFGCWSGPCWSVIYIACNALQLQRDACHVEVLYHPTMMHAGFLVEPHFQDKLLAQMMHLLDTA